MLVANRFASCVALCMIESALRHATLCPARIVAGSGAKDRLPRLPWIVIVTSAV
jgi:hypothetical protein